MKEEKIIGRYTGPEKGPLIIVFGGVHGNEPAGVKALQLLFKMIEVEPITNPEFVFRGRIVGLIGNLKAHKKQERFIDADLNRIWTKENLHRIRNNDFKSLNSEEKELLLNMNLVEAEIKDYQPERLVILDLHTTSSHGGIFSIVPDDPQSIHLALELHAPVIKGMMKGIQGTILHYFNSENLGIKTTAVSFESGQHEDPLSINRAIAAITNCLRTIGCVDAEHVENRHDRLLIEYSKDLPKVSEMISRHAIVNEDDFSMKPNYENFQTVEKGEFIAQDKNGPIQACESSRILMPLYQDKGDDGFFLVKEIEGY